jgi:DNA mismatch endonuclease (patch repair protein)
MCTTTKHDYPPPSAARSKIMSSIRSKDTGPELAVRSYLHAAGLRFRLHRANLPGKPDIVLPRHRAVVFVHGCFWHGHEGCFSPPRTRAQWWAEKIARNRARDEAAETALARSGWRVFVVWECALRKARRDTTLSELVSGIRGPGLGPSVK